MQVNWEQIKLVLLGAVGGGIVLAVIGFAWGGWVTGGTAQEMAEELAQKKGRRCPLGTDLCRAVQPGFGERSEAQRIERRRFLEER